LKMISFCLLNMKIICADSKWKANRILINS
jgi:hypothetical protein